MTKNDIEKLNNIDCFVFDLDGTIYIDRTLIDGAKETIDCLREKGKKVIFLTNNSSVSAKYYVKKINDIGIYCDEKEVYTSGNATVRFLKLNYPNQSVYLVGTKELGKEFVEGGIKLTEECPDVVCLAYDKELTYQKLVLLTRYLHMGAKFIATHPDINCPAKPFYEPDVGAMLEMIEKSTGRRPEAICGKPYRPIAEGVSEACGLPLEKIAMVGDRMYTDIRFGLLNGMLSVLVLTGETTKEDLEKSDIIPDVVLNSVADIKTALEKE